MARLSIERPGPIDFDAVRAIALSSIIASAVKLKRHGAEHVGSCPFHPDRSPSFTVNDAKGFAHCFGCGWHGDAIDFLVAAHGCSVRDAAEMVLGLTIPAATFRPAPAQPEADRGDEARAIWQAAVPAIGTVAESYLRKRSISIPLPDTIRFARISLGRSPKMPTLIALVTDVNDQPIGIQRTFLSEDGRKADLPGGNVKFSLGRVRGGAIRLSPAAGEVALTEGLEDALSLMEMAGVACWASAGAGMLASVELPATISSVILGRDNDASGEREARKAAERFSVDGRLVRIVAPVEGAKDFNEELQMEAANGR